MKKKILGLALLLSAAAFSLQAQVMRTFHNTYDVDEVENVTIEVSGEMEYVEWPGTTLMIESHVRLGNATKRVLDHLYEKGRYNIEDSMEGRHMTIVSSIEDRKPIVTQNGSCDEQVYIKVYVPESFAVGDEGNLVRTEPIDEDYLDDED